MKTSTKSILIACALLAACRQTPSETHFPAANRNVAPIVSDRFSTEDARDRLGEAERVIDFAELKPGMKVADVGAGEGYYTVRLAPVVGRKGLVLAEDISQDAHDALSDRVQRERLDNVAVKLGAPDDPMLPPRSFDRVFLVHMYHEVASPYAFLWHLRDSVKPNGEVILVDSDRPVKHHGIYPRQLACEFAAVGLKPVRFERLPGSDVYAAAFVGVGPRPAPDQIKPCRDAAA